VQEIGRINESRSEWLLRAFENAGRGLKRISKYKVWQDGNQPKAIETNEFLDQKLDYIHHNPVEAEIVDEPCHYLCSSARTTQESKDLSMWTCLGEVQLSSFSLTIRFDSSNFTPTS